MDTFISRSLKKYLTLLRLHFYFFFWWKTNILWKSGAKFTDYLLYLNIISLHVLWPSSILIYICSVFYLSFYLRVILHLLSSFKHLNYSHVTSPRLQVTLSSSPTCLSSHAPPPSTSHSTLTNLFSSSHFAISTHSTLAYSRFTLSKHLVNPTLHSLFASHAGLTSHAIHTSISIPTPHHHPHRLHLIIHT